MSDRLTILEGDSLEILPTLPAESISSIVTDPPYGLEFMGKDWDRFRVDDPGTMRHRGERVGGQGTVKLENSTNPAAGRVELGAGKRPSTSRCSGCGKRDQFRNVHPCTPEARWIAEPIDRYAAPPSSLAFQEWCRVWALECYRVAKPGAHLLAFGGTRTYHRLAAALEDVGWEIRDTLVWAYASGFPKSLDVSKAIDKAAGAAREVTDGPPCSYYPEPCLGHEDTGRLSPTVHAQRTAPATADAVTWTGWGTALKPAWEPIVMARKPLEGSVIRNVLEHGTGALNIGATRIPYESAADREYTVTNGSAWAERADKRAGEWDGPAAINVGETRDRAGDDLGRWPANVALTDPIFDRVPADDIGSFSRFFLVPKAGREDREPTLGGQLEASAAAVSSGGGGTQKVCGLCGNGWIVPPAGLPSCGHGREYVVHVPQANKPRENTHPTVKPVELMQHLVRLVTPPGGTVLDPFLGSGTTAIAAEMEGFACLGIERDPEYVAIARARLIGIDRGLGLEVEAPTARRSTSRSHWPAKRAPHAGEGWGFAGQAGLFERSEEVS